ncbi:ribosome biogenesis protein MAK21 [Geosmithia morbida]|uniref:Ribosome biogenesis protein MAK21 n=1 Tax=Geosmithia morbida TaxID=1094350 RepID=A0A9P4YYG8_9HYPO|nr:ribosome biogenesis protein MAK21 [Geosmithia morbida]KAF4123314.1 ribosome biogenesis protein MAK21 [Geosmithia morbida]
MAKPNKKGKGPKGLRGSKDFDESALTNLTSKLDKNLKGSDSKRKQPPSDGSPNQDRKRQRNSTKGSSKPSAAQGGRRADKSLLDEIRALGGDEEDLALIQDIDSSDDEVVKDSNVPVDKKLKDELAAFSKNLGFSDHQLSEAGDSEDDAGQDDEDGEDQAEDDEEEKGDDQQDDDDEEAIFEPRADWHAAKLPQLPGPSSENVGPYAGAVEALKIQAKKLLEGDAEKYRTSVFASSSHKFLATIMTSGTLNDKVSALTLAIQESPLHNIRAFDTLMNLASKKSRAQAIGAIGAIVDMLGPGVVLPANRRLRSFQTQPGLIGTLQKTSTKSWSPEQPLPGRIIPRQLISWAYEDWLKDTYFKILQLLEAWSSDEIEYSRSRALDFIYGLLKEKPEQEANLLRLLVNKLGDRDRKIASRTSYLLLQLQTSHPGMKPIIIRTVEQEILLHPSQDHRSKYYAINTLNQTILSAREPNIAEHLMQVYFDLFVTLLKAGSLGISLQKDQDDPAGAKNEMRAMSAKPGKGPQPEGKSKPSEQEIEAADKLVSAILTGVNRAAPFVGANDTIMEKHMDTLFKIAHSTNFNTGIQALLLIQHLSTVRSLGTDRFYRTLYESLLDPRLVTSSKQALYLNLVLRALKNDLDVRRVKAFVKRMLQITHLHQPPFICGLLYVVAHLRRTFPDLDTLIQDPEESIFDDEPADQRPVYDGRKRDPEHSNAQRSCLWELLPLQAHFHPSVAVFALALTDKTREVTKPDIDSHSLIKFLDKFVYKEPKANESSRGVSIMQPLKATRDEGDIWLGRRGAASAVTSVNSNAFKGKKPDEVSAEDVFFHKYFQHASKEPRKAASKVAGDEDEDEDEDEIWKALVSSRPDVDGDADSEGFSDLDADDMASDDDESQDDEVEDDEPVDIEGDSDDQGLVAALEEDEESEVDEAKERRDKRKAHRKEIKALPMFASVDDYAQLLAQDEDEEF